MFLVNGVSRFGRFAGLAAVGCLLLLVAFCAGCGGGGLSSTTTTAATGTVTATPETNPAAVQVAWTAATLTNTQSFIGYNVYRNGGAIASVNAATTSFTDSTATASHNLTLATVPTGTAAMVTSSTVSVGVLSTGTSVAYTVTVVYLDNTNTGQSVYREVTLGTSAALTLPTGATSVTATEATTTTVSVVWTAPSLGTGQTLVAYNVYRDGTVIGSASGGTLAFTDATTTATHNLTFSTVISGASAALSSQTVSVVPVTGGVAHIYTVTVVYLDTTTGSSVYHEVTLGTSAAVTLPS